MKAWNTTEQDIREAADEVGLAIHSDWSGNGITRDGRALRFRLALGTDKENYRSIKRGRRIAAVCWHGHRDFFRALYRRSPEARIKTALADYRGTDGFERDFPATGQGNVGSWAEPQAAQDACDCSFDIRSSGDRLASRRIEFATLTPTGLTNVRTLRQSDIAACPFVIFVADHYREDGSCRCDDADERVRMIEEWEYTEEDFADIPLRSTV
jgi:hypothetical protein